MIFTISVTAEETSLWAGGGMDGTRRPDSVPAGRAVLGGVDIAGDPLAVEVDDAEGDVLDTEVYEPPASVAKHRDRERAPHRRPYTADGFVELAAALEDAEFHRAHPRAPKRRGRGR